MLFKLLLFIGFISSCEGRGTIEVGENEKVTAPESRDDSMDDYYPDDFTPDSDFPNSDFPESTDPLDEIPIGGGSSDPDGSPADSGRYPDIGSGSSNGGNNGSNGGGINNPSSPVADDISLTLVPLSYKNRGVGVEAVIVSKLRYSSGKVTLETDCEFKKGTTTEKTTSRVEASGSYSANTISITESKASFTTVEVESLKLGCSSVLDVSSAQIIQGSDGRYLKYQNGAAIRVAE